MKTTEFGFGWSRPRPRATKFNRIDCVIIALESSGNARFFISHLKSWIIETSVDGKSWRGVAREENWQLSFFTAAFAVADRRERRFIRLVNTGRNFYTDDKLLTTAWEILGDSSNKRIPPIALMSLRFPFYLPLPSAPFAVFSFPLSARTRGRRAPIDGPKPSSHTGAIASPAGPPPQGNDGSPRGLDDPLLPRGFDLVPGVTNRSTMSHSHLQPPSVVLVQILQ
jgi:hypothetical protein